MITSVQAIDNTTDFLKIRNARITLQHHALQETCEQTTLPEEVIEDLIDGVLLLTDTRELIYANHCARRVLRQLNQDQSPANQIPEEVWHICQTLIDSRQLFPNQYWLIESKVIAGTSVVFHIRARWLKLKDREQSCLLLNIRDQCRYIKDIVSEESERYGLTSREKEIWLLHRANYTYKQIAVALCITPNTVKKHMKGIYSKQKTLLETQNA
ncbi:helix-turn-helix transcriptional regulator [Nodosilinea sp. LEGE 07088]|uniref:helix-turn-helix transcriptional regulator n=1 Tax=Nodosilinea sp. LEGE 07088 TaxID=2777968 RepID=UPI001881C248|nr:LuxR C-terminal-related transcriptional regulator [Nodosilinea sp. LEGE 07088]MBE9138489.1 helix-turn-helix transcriptional regulator [Nodosilinea sp. LEGE 07088]